MQNLDDVETWLTTIRAGVMTSNWEFKLEHMQALMQKLGDPQEKFKSIHVAGTSGKTSTSYYIAEMLRLANKKVGLTVSPHVDSINERVQINGQPLTKTEFLKQLNSFVEVPVVKNASLSYFGALLALAFWVFAEKKLDYGVIEVGLGGRLDASNVIKNPNKICVITDIGLDHTKVLGGTLTKIAAEKAGIIQPGNHVFVAKQAPEIMEVFARVAYKQGAAMHVLPNEKIAQTPDYLSPFQKRNWALARSVFEFVTMRDRLPHVNLEPTAKLQIPARMEEFKVNQKIIITDGSHNAQKIGALVAGLQQAYPGKKFAVMVSFVSDKDVTLSESLKELHKISDCIIATTFDAQQDAIRTPIDAQKIVDAAKQIGFKNVISESNPELAFKILQQQSEEYLLVTGSFFLLGHVRPQLKKLQ